MRRRRYVAADVNTTTNLADGPLTAAGGVLRWDTVGFTIASLVILVLAGAILAVWVAPVDAAPLPAARRSPDTDQWLSRGTPSREMRW